LNPAPRNRLLRAGVGLAFVVSGAFVIMASLSSRPANLGVTGGSLSPCPSTPNCVCSQNTNDPHYTPPLEFKSSVAEARAKLKQAVLGMSRSALVEEREDYLAFEFRSAIFRFVDDVEFLVRPGQNQIQVRSASRTGHSDLGVNRRRVEAIRLRFDALHP